MCKRLYERYPPEDAGQTDERLRHLLGIVDLAELVVNWVASTSTNVLHNMRRMLDSRAFHIIGYVVPFIAEQRHTKIDSIFNTISSYTLYPHKMRMFFNVVATLVTPQLLKTPDTSYRKGSFGTTVTHLIPYREVLESSKQRGLCDNIKHLDHFGTRDAAAAIFTERVCSACRTVAYCSVRCQREDWKSIHHLECAFMAKEYCARNPDRSLYHHRKFHANTSSYTFETTETVQRSSYPRLPNGKLS
ncbi:hypothetical protein FA13DRAFT_164551 [Coprinellus micaceus]|uniref:MYND-type domain-containing protein n=1 Tax=Coprinellus micaceus TaxID=71717 RepID=A0A4Y7SHQ4_COPMI|nr:hypothetical protein FA13DRAFT_164551 [Coprinellus micaceus]